MWNDVETTTIWWVLKQVEKHHGSESQPTLKDETKLYKLYKVQSARSYKFSLDIPSGNLT